MRPVNRITPKLPVHAMKTYTVAAPRATHWRAASCEEAGCRAHANGWVTVVDEATVQGQRQAHYIRRQSGRKFVEERTVAGTTRFTFEAGQTCFRPHEVPLERDPLFVVRGGDWRGATGENRRHVRAADWVDDFATHQDRLAARLAQG